MALMEKMVPMDKHHTSKTAIGGLATKTPESRQEVTKVIKVTRAMTELMVPMVPMVLMGTMELMENLPMSCG